MSVRSTIVKLWVQLVGVGGNVNINFFTKNIIICGKCSCIMYENMQLLVFVCTVHAHSMHIINFLRNMTYEYSLKVSIIKR